MVRRTVRFATAFALLALSPVAPARAIALETVMREVAAENPSRAQTSSARSSWGRQNSGWPSALRSTTTTCSNSS